MSNGYRSPYLKANKPGSGRGGAARPLPGIRAKPFSKVDFPKKNGQFSRVIMGFIGQNGPAPRLKYPVRLCPY